MSDPLSDALRSVRLDGAVFLDVCLTAPFALTSTFTAEDARAMLADPVQLLFCHVVLEGETRIEVEGEAPMHKVCGFPGSARGINPLIADLPRVLKIALADAAEHGRAGMTGWPRGEARGVWRWE